MVLVSHLLDIHLPIKDVGSIQKQSVPCNLQSTEFHHYTKKALQVYQKALARVLLKFKYFATYIWSSITIEQILINCMVFNAVFNSTSVLLRRPVHLSMLPGILVTSTPHNTLSKPLAAFQHNHCRNNGQW